jgi:hypothetical protein
MDTLGELLRISCWGCCGSFALFLILLALPQSRLRYYVLRGLGIVFFTITGLLALYILSPVDALPDVIPLLGQIDDGGALVSAIGRPGRRVGWWNSKQSKSYRAERYGRAATTAAGIVRSINKRVRQSETLTFLVKPAGPGRERSNAAPRALVYL